MEDSEQSTSELKNTYFSGEAGRVFHIQQVKCPNCGGVVDVSSEQAQATCKFCRHQFAVSMAHPDFVVDRGVLTKYCGESLEVVVPDNVTAIGPAAFVAKDTLTRIVLPDSVQELQATSTFSRCRSLKTIVLPENMEIIPDCVFSECESLKSITLPKNLKMMGRMVFYKCKNLTSIEIPPGVKIVERDVFMDCKKLETIFCGENTEFRGYNFGGCPKLSTLIILDSCTGEKIEERRIVEDDCGGHSEVTVWVMPDEERAELSRRAAESAQQLQQQQQPPQQPQETPPAASTNQAGGHVEMSGDLNKLSCPSCGGMVPISEGQIVAICPFCRNNFTVSLESPDFVIDGGVLVKYTGESSEVTVPDGVMAIGLLAFYGQSSLTKIVLPDSVIEMQGGFMGCRSLETLILSNNIEIIPDMAFQDCASLKNIHLPHNLRYVGQLAFCNCSSLTTITIPPMPSIQKMVFYNCTDLETIIRYENTELAGDYFVLCDKLSTLIILDNNSGEKIAEKRFAIGEQGWHYEIPVWSTDKRAPIGASSNEAGTAGSQPVPAVAPTGPAYAVPAPTGPAYATPEPSQSYTDEPAQQPEQEIWPRDVKCVSCGATIQIDRGQTLASCMFCQSQFSVNVDYSDFVIDGDVLVKYNGRSREVFVPDSVRAIGALAFYQQTTLKKIVLPHSVTELQGTFAGCYGLETLILSDNIETIASGTFKDCVNLTTIVLPWNLRTLEKEAFLNCASLVTVEIPPLVETLYKEVFEICEDLETIVCYKGTKLRGREFRHCPRLSTLIILDPETGKKVSEKRIS